MNDFIHNSSFNPGYPEYALLYGKYQFKDSQVNTQCEDWSREIIKEYSDQIKNGIIVEIGVFGGATLLDLYQTCKENGNKICGIDPFDKIRIFNGVPKSNTSEEMVKNTRDLYKFNRENLDNIISKYNLADVITVFNETSRKAAKRFPDKIINLLHIDGDHSSKGVYKDLTKFYPKMASGGIILGDDYQWESVQIGLKRFCSTNDIKYKLSANGNKFIIQT